MKTIIAFALAISFIAVGAAAAGAQSTAAGSFKIAQASSCQSWFGMCASRCKTRAPQDKNCVSDHCAPKLAECRRNGCWQEGAAYGGGRHCGLSK